jgi:hypothetical protein
VIAALLACAGPGGVRVPSTTAAIGTPDPAEEGEWTIDIRTSRAACEAARVSDPEACLPWIDRAAGEAHLSFELRDPSTGSPLTRSLAPDQVVLLHDGARQADVALIPHDPVVGGQLFVLVLDGSGSMFADGATLARALHDALLRPDVVAGFFPEGDGATAVLPLRFSDRLTAMDGGPARLVTTREDYEKAVQTYLATPGAGYTHLYAAVRSAMTDVLQEPSVASWLASRSSEPVVVALTDGFNNESSADTCASNVPRLQATLDAVRDARLGRGARVRPTLLTAGIGRPYTDERRRRGFDQRVTTEALCGRYGDFAIDGGLERAGLDHVSLEWLAEAGGGLAFVKQEAQGLAAVFRSASAPRHRWYEVRYRVPGSYWMRRSFDVELRLEGTARAMTRVRIHPDRWLDAPPGVPESIGTWRSAAPGGRGLGLLAAIWSGLAFLAALPVALWTAWRRIIG